MAKTKRQSFTTSAPGTRKSKAKNKAKASAPAKKKKSKLELNIRITDLPILERKLKELEKRLDAIESRALDQLADATDSEV